VAFSPISFSFQFLLLPLFLFEIFLLSLGISFFLSLIFVKFRDIAHIWDIVLQMGFWLTPIIYPLSMIENPAYHWVFRINPIASIINHARNLIILGQVPDLRTHLIFLLALISFALGSYAFFQSKEEGIVENL
jgi:ABC-type polysaccharide/polyol phosphate export permease